MDMLNNKQLHSLQNPNRYSQKLSVNLAQG